MRRSLNTLFQYRQHVALTHDQVFLALVFQFGTLFTTGSFGKGFAPGMIAIVVFAAIVVAMIAKTNKSLAKEKAAKQRA